MSNPVIRPRGLTCESHDLSAFAGMHAQSFQHPGNSLAALPLELIALIIEHVYLQTTIGIGDTTRHWPVAPQGSINPRLAILRVSRSIRAVALSLCSVYSSVLFTIDQEIGFEQLRQKILELEFVGNLRRVQFLAKVPLWLWKGQPGRRCFAFGKHPKCRRHFTIDLSMTYNEDILMKSGSFCSCLRDGCAAATIDAVLLVLSECEYFDAKSLFSLWRAAHFDFGMLQSPDTWIKLQHGGIGPRLPLFYGRAPPAPPVETLKRQLLYLDAE